MTSFVIEKKESGRRPGASLLSEFVSCKIACEFYNRSPQTLGRWVKKGKIERTRDEAHPGSYKYTLDPKLNQKKCDEAGHRRYKLDPNAPIFVTSKIASEYYGVSGRTLIRWANKGKIEATRDEADHRRYKYKLDPKVNQNIVTKKCAVSAFTLKRWDPSFLTGGEAERFYGVSLAVLRRWVKKGIIQAALKNINYSYKPDPQVKANKCKYLSKELCYTEDCKWCIEKSFASQPKAEFWSEKNELSPRDVFRGSDEYFLFNCIICLHEFPKQLYSIRAGQWCPFCAHQKLCTDDCDFCFENSFASHEKAEFWSEEKNENVNPRTVFKSTSDDFWFDCHICKHEFKSQLFNITEGTWCGFCSSPPRRLCSAEEGCELCLEKSFASHEKATFWSEKNETSPINVFKSSNDPFLFNCNICFHEFKASLNSIKAGSWCPVCKNKTELKLFEWLINKYSCTLDSPIRPEARSKAPYKIFKEFSPDWCKNPENNKSFRFDFLIKELKLFIELDGPQHFRQTSNWKGPVETRKRDIYKMNQALVNGYSVIRILQEDVWLDKNNWETNLTASIRRYETPQITYICTKDEYYQYPDFTKKQC